MTQDDDLGRMVTDGEDTLTIGTVTVRCKVWTVDEAMSKSPDSQGQIMGMSHVLVQASRFPGLKNNDPITINNVAMTVGTLMRIHDGKLLQVWLTKGR